MNDNILRQRLSFSQKKKNDFEWGKKNIKSIVGNYGPGTSFYSDDYKRKISNYRLYNNDIDVADLKYECSLLGIKEEDFKDIIQPYIWVYNVINVLIGENESRPFNHKAMLLGADGVNAFNREQTTKQREFFLAKIQSEVEGEKAKIMEANPPQLTGDEEQDQKIMQEHEQQVQDQLQKAMMDEKILDPAKIKEYMATWKDEREILANDLLKFYHKKLNISDIKSDAFKHGQIAGEEFQWLGLDGNNPIIRPLNTINFLYHKSPEIKFVQDGDYAAYIEYLSVNEILNRYHDSLEKKDIEKLEGFLLSGTDGYGMDVPMMGKESNYRNESFEHRYNKHDLLESKIGSYGSGEEDDLIQVVHAEWVSQREVWFIQYIDENGEEQEDMIATEFKVPKGAEKMTERVKGKNVTTYFFEHPSYGPVEAVKKWIPEVWEGTMIDNDTFANIRPKEHQYRSLDNPWRVKLGYRGVIYNNMNASSVSTMDRMKPYQYLYLITMHKMQKMMALDKPPVMDIDVDEIPDNIDKKEFLHFMDTAGVKFTQKLKHADNPAAANLMATTKSGTSDRSTLNHILNYYTVLNFLKQDIMLAAGVPPERLAQTSQQQSVTGMQQNVQQSAHITNYQFRVHDLNWSLLLNDFLNLSITQIQRGKLPFVQRFILEDSSVVNLSITPETFDNVTIGLFVSNSSKEHAIFEHLRQMTQALIQNDKINLSILSKMLSADSLQELNKEIETYEANQAAQDQQMQQMQQEHESKMAEREIEFREDNQAHEIQLKTMDIEKEIYIQQMETLQFTEATPEQVHKFVDAEQERSSQYQLETEKGQREEFKELRKESLEREKLATGERVSDKDNKAAMEREQLKAKTALKNKVAGEK
jgi:hypothetical protein